MIKAPLQTAGKLTARVTHAYICCRYWPTNLLSICSRICSESSTVVLGTQELLSGLFHAVGMGTSNRDHALPKSIAEKLPQQCKAGHLAGTTWKVLIKDKVLKGRVELPKALCCWSHSQRLFGQKLKCRILSAMCSSNKFILLAAGHYLIISATACILLHAMH